MPLRVRVDPLYKTFMLAASSTSELGTNQHKAKLHEFTITIHRDERNRGAVQAMRSKIILYFILRTTAKIDSRLHRM